MSGNNCGKWEGKNPDRIVGQADQYQGNKAWETGLFVTERGVLGFGVATNAAGQISIRGNYGLQDEDYWNLIRQISIKYWEEWDRERKFDLIIL